MLLLGNRLYLRDRSMPYLLARLSLCILLRLGVLRLPFTISNAFVFTITPNILYLTCHEMLQPQL